MSEQTTGVGIEPNADTRGRGRLEVWFKSLENGVPDVVVHPLEGRAHLPVRDLNALLEEYLHGPAYLRVDTRTSREFSEEHWRCMQLKELRAEGPEEVGSVGSGENVLHAGGNDGNHGDLPVLIPIVHFVEQPQGVLIERLPSGIWGKRTDVASRGGIQELDTSVTGRDGRVEDGELSLTFILRRHRWRVALGQGEYEVVEAIPEAVEGITDDLGEVVRKWLQKLCKKHGAPIAFGLLKDSIAVARPPGHNCFDIVDVRLCSAELATVARDRLG